MQFPSPLRRGRLVQRYKRFFADVALDGEVVTAHCPNPGAMLGLNLPGMPCWVSRSESPTRKLPWTLELVEAEDGLVGVNTHLPNALAAEALAGGAIPELAGYAGVRREVKYGDASRVDFLLEHPDRPPCWLEINTSPPNDKQRCWVEVKSVTLSRTSGLAEWPDCVSTRAAKHVRELSSMTRDGDRAVILFVVQRRDNAFDVADDIDPVFADALREAVECGLEVLVYGCDISPMDIRLSRRISWDALSTTGRRQPRNVGDSREWDRRP